MRLGYASVVNESRERAPLWVIFSGLMLVLLMAALDGTIVATALPTIVDDLGGLEHISWVTSAYLLAQTAVTPLYGKLGDLYGRKRILQGAVLLFLAGSALCGLARTMTELIAFRAVQGLGAGGLIVLTQAVIGDIVTPRERGKYQGIFGAVFGTASVIGPLLGGFIVQQWSWNWIFYVNLPVGLLALVVITRNLPSTQRVAHPVIDYLGAGLLATGLSSIVLITSLGGTTWEWASTETFVTGAIGLLALALFAIVERRAREPVLPPALWREPVFRAAGALSFVAGFALFGAITFLPLYFQTVDSDTPTESGLRMLPMMLGLLITSIGSGQAISRIGRYKVFPIVGTAVMTVGLVPALAAGDRDQHRGRLAVPVRARARHGRPHAGAGARGPEQRAVRGTRDRDVRRHPAGAGSEARWAPRCSARSSRTGSSTSVPACPRPCRRSSPAADGSPLRRSTRSRPRRRPRTCRASSTRSRRCSSSPPASRWSASPSAGCLPEQPLRATAATSHGLDDSLAAPRNLDSLAELERALARVTTREDRMRFHGRVAERAGVELSPGATWALVRIDEHGFAGARAMAAAQRVPEERITAVVAELREDGLVTGEPDAPELSTAGRALTDQVVAARRELLAEAIADDTADRPPEVDELLRRLARELVGERP